MQSDGHANNASAQRVLRVTPNCSLTSQQASLFFLSLVAGTLLISGSVALMGFWLVLPFAGLELLAIGYALKLVQERGRYQEVVRISHDELVIERGNQSVEHRDAFPRYWSSVRLAPARVASYPSKLLVGCMGKSLEVGACLTETERIGLSRRMRRLVGPVETLPEVRFEDNA